MFLRRLAILCLALSGLTPFGFALTTASSALAETSPPVLPHGAAIAPEVARLSNTMMIGTMMEVMHDEGLDYGHTLEAEMFDGRGGAGWQAVVGLIYDPVVMRERFDAAFAAEISDDLSAVAQMQDFFGSALGQRILTLEIEARRALADEAVEDAAKTAVETMIADADPRMQVLERFEKTNDLIESNVAGALNSNFAFFQGLAEGGALTVDMTEQEMLATVWSQEEQIREDTRDWLFSYLALAYGPLSEADMAAYQAFSETGAGQRLNAALFQAFDVVFTQIARDLGLAAARQMRGEDI